jgi:hypothetical protein
VDTNILITKKSHVETQHAVSPQNPTPNKNTPRRDAMHCVSTTQNNIAPAEAQCIVPLQNTPQFYACTVGSDFNSDTSIADYFEQHKQLMPRMNKSAWIISSDIEPKLKKR